MASLSQLLNDHQLPESLTIESIQNKIKLEIDFGNTTNKKNNIYTGILNGSEVIIKEIKKNEIRIEEIKILWTLTRKRIDDQSICKSCNKIVCENFTKLIGCYEENGNIYIVLEKANYNYLEFKKKTRDKKIIKEIFFELAKAVKCLHANFIAHLDISASNVLIVEENKKISVRLADFGESEIFEGTNISINPLNPRKSFRVTKMFDAPERSDFHGNEPIEKNKTRNMKFCFDPYKVDIYALGIFFMKFCLGIEVNVNNKFEIPRLLEEARSTNNITFLEEELALFMVENEPTKRIDIKGVCTSPIFWNHDAYYNFIKKVVDYKINHKSKPKIFTIIEEEFFEKFFTENRKWLDVIGEQIISNEIIKRRTTSAKMVPNSMFSLFYHIVEIYNSENNFQESKLVTKANTNRHDYMNFWMGKFKTLIDLLYFYMKNDLKKLHPDLNGISTPDRCFKKRKLTL